MPVVIKGNGFAVPLLPQQFEFAYQFGYMTLILNNQNNNQLDIMIFLGVVLSFAKL